MSADPLASALRRAEDIVVQFPRLSPEEATTRVRDHIATFCTPDTGPEAADTGEA